VSFKLVLFVSPNRTSLLRGLTLRVILHLSMVGDSIILRIIGKKRSGKIETKRVVGKEVYDPKKTNQTNLHRAKPKKKRSM